MAEGRVPGPLGAQEPTLSELEANPPPFIEVNTSLKSRAPQELEKMTDERAKKFFLEELGKYANQIYESATSNKIPPQLLATVILNELADISWGDITQEAWPFSRGSLGIAQIQVSTAVRHNLVPGQLIHSPGPLQSQPPPNPAVVANRLRIPQFAIEGAARYIRIILEKMCANTDKPWMQAYRFNLTNFNQISRAQDIYNYVAGTNEVEKEATLAKLVAAIYNSEDIVIAQKYESVDENKVSDKSARYWQAIVHGNNATSIARLLYRLSLFR